MFTVDKVDMRNNHVNGWSVNGFVHKPFDFSMDFLLSCLYFL